MPTKADLEKIRALVGFADLVLQPAARTVQLRSKGARIGVRGGVEAIERQRGIVRE